MLEWFYPRKLGVILLLIKRITAVFLCLTILFSFAACGKKEAKNANKKINYILAAEPKTLDPQIATDSSAIVAIEALYEGLARLGTDYKAYPGVAEKWESNADSTVFTFTIRSGAKWSREKTPITANDFVFAFRRALSPQTGSTTCSQMFCIKNAKEVNSGALAADQLGVTAKDTNTLVVQLNYSYPDFPVLTAAAVFMPCNQKFFESTSGRYGLERKYLIGNGPFEIDGKYGWEHGKYLNLVRSATYTGNKKSLPSNLKFSIAGKETDVSDPVALLTKGTADAIEMPADKVNAAATAGCTITSFEDTTWGLCFNMQSDIMKNKNMRKAFIQAFDRTAVTKHLPKNINLAESIIPPSTTWMGKSYQTLATGGPFYLKQDKNAAALLTAGLNELSLPKLPNINVICPDNPSVKLMLNEMIATWNTKFNYYFNMEPLNEDELSARIKSGNYQIALCPIRPDSNGPLSVLSLFKTGAKKNSADLKDSTFDAMLADAESRSGSEAVSAFAAAEKYLNEQGIFYPLYYEKHYHATAKGITGVVFLPYGAGVDFIQAGKE